MLRLLASLLAAALLLGACSDEPAPPALDKRLPTVDQVAAAIELDGGWTLAATDPLVGLILDHEAGELPEATVSYAESSTFDIATADAYLEDAVERLGQGRDRYELRTRDEQPVDVPGTRSLRFTAAATVDGIPLEVSVLVIVGFEATLIAQVVHEPGQPDVEKPRVDALFDAVGDAVAATSSSVST